jgi:hypothetical protein
LGSILSGLFGGGGGGEGAFEVAMDDIGLSSIETSKDHRQFGLDPAEGLGVVGVADGEEGGGAGDGGRRKGWEERGWRREEGGGQAGGAEGGTEGGTEGGRGQDGGGQGEVKRKRKHGTESLKSFRHTLGTQLAHIRYT